MVNRARHTCNLKIVIAFLGRKRSKQAVANVNEMSSLASFTLYLSPVLSESCHNVFFSFYRPTVVSCSIFFFFFFKEDNKDHCQNTCIQASHSNNISGGLKGQSTSIFACDPTFRHFLLSLVIIGPKEDIKSPWIIPHFVLTFVTFTPSAGQTRYPIPSGFFDAVNAAILLYC